MPVVGQRGASAAEYLGVIAVVAVLLGGLLTVGEHRVRRHAPVDPVEVLVRSVAVPAPARRPRARRGADAAPRPAMVPPRPRPARPARPLVEVPRWARGGW